MEGIVKVLQVWRVLVDKSDELHHQFEGVGRVRDNCFFLIIVQNLGSEFAHPGVLQRVQMTVLDCGQLQLGDKGDIWQGFGLVF